MAKKRFYQPSAAMTTPEGYEKVEFDTAAGAVTADTQRMTLAADDPAVVLLGLIQSKGTMPRWTTFTNRTTLLANGINEDVFPGEDGVFVQAVFRNLGPNDATYRVNGDASGSVTEADSTKQLNVGEEVELSFMTDKRINFLANGSGGALIQAEERS